MAATTGMRRTIAPATGFWSWVPLPLQSLWLYHEAIYASNVNLTSPHSYASPAWQWPLMLRPTSMYYQGSATGENGCSAIGNGCAENISSISNPLLWWAAVIAVLYLVWRCFARRNAGDWLVLTGVIATYVPWLLYPNRTIFQFYTIVILPFMILALTAAAAGSRTAAHAKAVPARAVVRGRVHRGRAGRLRLVLPGVDRDAGVIRLLASALPARRLGVAQAPAQAGRAAAAARAAAGSASRIRARAASSCAAVRNHASNTLGGSETPASSIAWKNGGYRQASCARASS